MAGGFVFCRSYDTHTLFIIGSIPTEREREGKRERVGRGESFRHFVHSDAREHFYGCWLEKSSGVMGVYAFFYV